MKKAFVAATSFFLAISVYAANMDGDHKAKFQELDTDGSGAISLEEARNGGIDEAMFNRHDTDGNGELSEQEFMAKKDSKGDRNKEGTEYSR